MILAEQINLKTIYSTFVFKVKDIGTLVKFKLNLTVVFSAAFGYLLAVGKEVDWFHLLLLSIGGFAITGSANALNQVIEKDYDKLMKRTATRPLPTNRMSVTVALLIAGLLGVGGVSLIGYAFNTLAAMLGAISLLLYAFVYTPLKRLSPIAVLVGAIPGALPPLIGWVAVTNYLDYNGLVLFGIQFLWQFPHFWAIGWIGYDEYNKAGFKMLPTKDGRSKVTAWFCIVYILFLIAVNCIPTFIGMLGNVSLMAVLVTGVLFLWSAIRLLKECTNKAALQLMFASLIYLMATQITMIFEKIFCM